jgi:hypothetical protein
MSGNGIALAYVYAVDAFARSASSNSLTHAEALSIAKAICHLARWYSDAT